MTEAAAGQARRRGQPWRSGLLLLMVLPLACWVFFESQRTFRADWASAAERQMVLAWVSGADQPDSPQEWEDARAALQVSLDLSPRDPDMVERMGDLYTVAGGRDRSDPTRSRAHYQRAAGYYEASLALRPSAPQTWAMLAAARQAMDAPPAQVQEAWARARALGPFEGHVQPILMRVVLAGWQDATPGMQDWAKDLFDRGDAATRREINAMAQGHGLRFLPDPPGSSASAPAAKPSAP